MGISVLLTVLALGIIPHSPIISDTFDRVEINRYHDDNGRFVFEQLIFYDWDSYGGRFRCEGFLLAKDDQRDKVSYSVEGNSIILNGGGEIRNIKFKSLHRSWTQYDVEMELRKPDDKKYRRGLTDGSFKRD